MQKIKKIFLSFVSSIVLFTTRIYGNILDEPILYGPPSYLNPTPTSDDFFTTILKYLWAPVALIIVGLIGLLSYIGIKSKKDK